MSHVARFQHSWLSAARTQLQPKHSVHHRSLRHACRCAAQRRQITPLAQAAAITQDAATKQQMPQASSKPNGDVWQSFAQHAGGEWEGVTVTLSSSGEAQELPPRFVPDEYRQWEQQVFDWQSQCSTLINDKGLTNTVKRLMPTVGCEADAQNFLEDKVQALQSDQDEGEDKTVLSCGCYSAGPRDLQAAGDRARFEHCLMLGQEQRIRIVQNVRREGDSWAMADVEVHHEQYDCPYNGGRELSGCGGGMANIANKPRLEAGRLEGDWQTVSGRSFKALQDSRLQASDRADRMSSTDSQAVTPLPLNAYSIVQPEGPGTLLLEAGVLLQDGGRAVSARRYEQGCCTAIHLGQERQS